jgi:hypothetical protein
MLDGPFVGQIKDLRNDVALEFLRDGCAGRAFEDAPPWVTTIEAASGSINGTAGLTVKNYATWGLQGIGLQGFTIVH